MECTNNELKEYVREYLLNKREIKELIRESYILTEQGTNTYYKLKSRNEELKTILEENKVKL